jgi:Flp pilus assembly protein TadD
MSSSSDAKQATRPSGRGRYWWLASIAVIYAGLIYLNALHNPYVYDDNRTVLNNVSIEDIRNVQHIVFRESTRPLVNFSYALDRAIWRSQPLGHHLTSVLLHVLNVFLVFHLAWLATEDRRARSHPGASDPPPSIPAFVAASLFGLHPMQTEAVGYISGRSEVLYAAFFLLALLAGRRWIRGDGRRWLPVALSLWAASLLCKEVAVFWPVVMALYDRYVMRSPLAEWRSRFRRVYLPSLLVTALAGVARVAVLLLIEHPEGAQIMWRFAAVEVIVAFRYFSMLLAPSGQSIFHQVDDVTRWVDPNLWMAIVWLVVWLAVAVRLRRLDGVAALGLFWFVLLLVPSAVLVMLDLGEPMAEHRVYLASAGMFLAVGTGLGRAWVFFETRGLRSQLLLKFLLAAWLTVLGGQTVLRNETWASPVRLWLDAVQKSPDVWVPHVLLGEALEQTKSPENAVAEYRMAISLRPSEPVPYMKLGLCLAQLGRLEEAAAAFRTLETVSPGSAVARNGLGAVAFMEGKYAEARQHYQSALAAHPNDVASRQSLAMMAEAIDRDPATALRLCEEIGRVAPGTPGNDECIERNRRGAGSASPH